MLLVELTSSFVLPLFVLAQRIRVERERAEEAAARLAGGSGAGSSALANSSRGVDMRPAWMKAKDGTADRYALPPPPPLCPCRSLPLFPSFPLLALLYSVTPCVWSVYCCVAIRSGSKPVTAKIDLRPAWMKARDGPAGKKAVKAGPFALSAPATTAGDAPVAPAPFPAGRGRGGRGMDLRPAWMLKQETEGQQQSGVVSGASGAAAAPAAASATPSAPAPAAVQAQARAPGATPQLREPATAETSRVLLLRNMAMEVDDDLKEDIAEECARYGQVDSVRFFHPPAEMLRIFVEFGNEEAANKGKYLPFGCAACVEFLTPRCPCCCCCVFLQPLTR